MFFNLTLCILKTRGLYITVCYISPGDYASNGCQGKGPGCLPCPERFVSCVGRPNGNNSYPGQEMTRKYVVCQSGRTVGEGECRGGYFDPVRRICATRLDSGMQCTVSKYCCFTLQNMINQLKAVTMYSNVGCFDEDLSLEALKGQRVEGQKIAA